AEERSDAVDDALSDLVRLEGARDEPTDFGEDLGFAPAAFHLAQEMRVPDRDGGVIGQTAERRLVPIAERTRGAVEDVEQALELAVLDGNDDLRDHARGL